jgi:hypothetical protein
MIEEHTNIVLTEDLPENGLAKGDVGVVVHVHKEGEAYEVEFLAMDGSTVALLTLEASLLREADARMIPHVREIAV